MFRVAILGAGTIAKTMARTLRGMAAAGEDVCPYAVASRNMGKAVAFASEEGFEKAYGSYRALMDDPLVDLIYIATPHAMHAEQMKLCLEAGKAVLCEKAFTGNANQAKEVLALAEEKKVLVTEAIWTRYLPSRRMIDQLIADGTIGEVRSLTSNLCYQIDHKERIMRPELAGGALLDIGIYPLNFAAMVFGTDVVKMESTAVMSQTGVDLAENITMQYADGKTAFLMSNVQVNSNRQCWIYGTEGALMVDNVNNPQVLTVYEDPRKKPVQVFRVPEQITGFEYEVRACRDAIREGRTECPEMPHEETLRMMTWMDQLRAQWNMKYPFD